MGEFIEAEWESSVKQNGGNHRSRMGVGGGGEFDETEWANSLKQNRHHIMNKLTIKGRETIFRKRDNTF